MTGDRRAYEYLGASIENFPADTEMSALLATSGFADASAIPLTGGIATIYTATKNNDAPRR